MHDHNRFETTKRASVVNATTNFGLSVLKIILGVFGHSHALLADGIHSFSDLFTDLLVFITAKISSRSPDKEHPYGHRRVETISTIILALILTCVAIGIGVDATHEIFSKIAGPKPDIIVIVIAAVSVIANEVLYHYNVHQGKKINSDLLCTNAWHKRSDALVSLIVLVSVLGTMLGAPYLDAIGALIIALLILNLAARMIWRSIQELIDTGVEEELIHQLSTHIKNVPGVIALHQLRTRSHGTHILLDVHIQVRPTISISEGHYISEQVGITLKKEFKKIVDVVVHVDPENDEEFVSSRQLPSRKVVEETVRSQWQSLKQYTLLKKIHLHYLNGKLILELYFPISAYQEELEKMYSQAIQDLSYIKQINIYYS